MQDPSAALLPTNPPSPAAVPPQAPLSQTLQRVHAAFECLLDIISLQQQLARAQPALRRRLGAGGPSGGAAGGGEGDEAEQGQAEEGEEEAVLLRIARDLLALGEWECLGLPCECR